MQRRKEACKLTKSIILLAESWAAVPRLPYSLTTSAWWHIRAEPASANSGLLILSPTSIPTSNASGSLPWKRRSFHVVKSFLLTQVVLRSRVHCHRRARFVLGDSLPHHTQLALGDALLHTFNSEERRGERNIHPLSKIV